LNQPNVEASPSSPGTDRKLLRHALATLAYRGGKVMRGVPAEFRDFRIGPASRSPIEILGHICDVLDWGLAMAEGEHRWSETHSTVWRDQVDRFFQALTDFDDYMASDRELGFPITQLLQEPVADSFTRDAPPLGWLACKGRELRQGEHSPGVSWALSSHPPSPNSTECGR